MPGKRATLAERFVAKYTSHPSGCHVWTGALAGGGYGAIGIGGRGEGVGRASRVVWEMHHGKIPDGLDIRHMCHNRSCVRIDHLEIGTRADNMRDMTDAGRQCRGEDRPLSKLTAKSVREIRRIYAGGDATQTQLASRFGVSRSAVGDAINRRTWKHI